jgi:tetratricopeptide (TPR) repeat protein
MTEAPATRLARLYAELKRRRVVRVAVGYLVVGWAVIEGSNTLTELLELPGWVGRTALALVLLALPGVLFLAWVFDLTPQGLERTGLEPEAEPELAPGPEPAPTPASAPQGSRSHGTVLRWRSAWFVLGFLVALSGAWFAIRGEIGGEGAGGADADLVAVLPFRVAGADPSLAYLREGMVDLLATKLTGEVGPRAVDPRTLLQAWRAAGGDERLDLAPEAAGQLGGRLGAGRVIVGEVVGTPGGLLLSASVLADGREGAREPVTVRGPADSLPALVDRLAAGLLSLGAGEQAHRLTHLTSTSLPALRAYLEGRTANRRGDYDQGRRHFEAALQHDSSFALAAIGLNAAAGWLGGLPDVLDRSLRLAWSSRDRLSPRDRAFLDAHVGPRYPRSFSGAESLAGWARALELADDRPEIWEGYGDAYFHNGLILELDGWDARAAEAFHRAVALDSGFVGALMHLVQDAARRGETAAVRQLAGAYLARDSVSSGAAFIRWRAAHALADSAALERLDPDSLGLDVLFWISISGQEEGFAPREAERAARSHHRRARTTAERQRALTTLYHALLNAGRPAEAFAVSRELEAVAGGRHEVLVRRVLDGLYFDGDRDAAASAAAALAAAATAEPGVEPGAELPGQADARPRAEASSSDCALEQWRLWQGQTATASATIQRLLEPDGAEPRPEGRTCAVLLEALRAVVAGEAGAARQVDRLDDLLRTAPPSDHELPYAMIALARLQDRLGRTDRALAAVRRRVIWSPNSVIGLAPMLREEARLAEILGDSAAAARAGAQYRALRHAPEPERGG